MSRFAGSLRLAAVAGATIALVAGVACNAILGNESRTLDDRDAAPFPIEAGSPDSSDGAACQADLATDPKHCGACGHDCLDGACSAGKCQPFVLAKGLPQPSLLRVVDGVVYWANGDGSVRSCSTKGCEQQPKLVMKVGTSNTVLSGLDVRDGTVFVAGYSTQQIYSCPIAGCTTTTTLAANQQVPVDVKSDGTNVYYINSTRASVERCVLPTCGAGPTRIAAGAPTWSGLEVAGQTAYWLDDGPGNDYSRAILYRARKTQVDGGAEVLLDDLPFPGSFIVRDQTLFMTQGGPRTDGGPPSGVVSAIDLDAGLATVTLATKQLSPSGIAVDATHVYWFSLGDGSLQRCEVAGCNDAPAMLVSGQNRPFGPALGDDAIYWTEYLSGTVKGLAK